MSVSVGAKRLAFDQVIGSIVDEPRFPEQVFRGRWTAFLFFDSDFLIAPDFPERVAELLNAERAEVCCLLNFDETEKMTYESAAMRFITASTSPQDYDAMLRRGGPAEGWLFGVDRYGCASDRGGWSIYCERQNDIAVIALHQPSDMEKYAACLKRIHAKPIKDQLEAGGAGLFSLNRCSSLGLVILRGTTVAMQPERAVHIERSQSICNFDRLRVLREKLCVIF